MHIFAPSQRHALEPIVLTHSLGFILAIFDDVFISLGAVFEAERTHGIRDGRVRVVGGDEERETEEDVGDWVVERSHGNWVGDGRELADFSGETFDEAWDFRASAGDDDVEPHERFHRLVS